MLSANLDVFGMRLWEVGVGDLFWKLIFLIKSGLEMIQLEIQFKTKSRIYIQKNIHSIEYRISNRIIHSKEFKENYSKFQ